MFNTYPNHVCYVMSVYNFIIFSIKKFYSFSYVILIIRNYLIGNFKNLEGNTPDERIITNTIKGLDVINGRRAGLIGFVENYLKLTRLPQPGKKPIKFAQLFEYTITLIEYESLNELVQITGKTNPPDFEIVADKEQISQVLINLIKIRWKH